jgi:hypothetical protein
MGTDGLNGFLDADDLVTGRLSAITTSLGCRVGYRNCSTQALNVCPFIAPSMTKGGEMALQPSAAMKGVVLRCPWGTEATQRFPLGDRPYRR